MTKRFIKDSKFVNWKEKSCLLAKVGAEIAVLEGKKRNKFG